MILQYYNTPIFYESTGKGPVVVLLHGFLESSTMWKKIIPELSKKNTVVSIDLPGHGKSGVVSETHTMELMADVVHTVLQHLNLASVTLIGHSMGGYVALAIAEKFPSEIKKLILLNSSPAEDSEERKENRKRALKVLVKNPEAFISMAISNLFSDKNRQKFTSEIDALKKEAYQYPLEGITAAIKGMMIRKDRTSQLKTFSKEKYMICAIDDPIMPIATSEILAKYSHTKLIEVPGGHMSHIESFKEIKEILLLIG